MKRATELDDIFKYKFLSAVKMNEAKDKVGFVVSKTNYDENKYDSNIYLYDVKKNEYHIMTGLGSEKDFVFEDDNHLLFVADRDGESKKAAEKGKKKTSLYRLDLNGGEAQKAYTFDKAVVSYKFIQDDKVILLCAEKLDEVVVDDNPESLKKWNESKNYEILDEVPFWFNGRGFINKIRARLYLHDLKEKTYTLLTGKYANVQKYEVSGDKVYLISDEFDSVDSQRSQIEVVDLKTLERKALTEMNTSVHNIAVNGDYLMYLAADGKTWGTSENAKLYKLNLKTNESEVVLEDDLSYGSSVGSDAKLYGGNSFEVKDGLLYFTLTVDNRSDLYCCDLEGNLKQLSDKEGSVDCFAVGNDEVYFIGMRDMRLQEVYCLKDKEEFRLTNLNEMMDEVEVLPLKKFSFINVRNIRIDGWVIEPRGYVKGQKYPAILDIHGGPKVVYGETFFHEMQYWASLGYFVLLCNPEGADGRGNEFMNLVNKYGTVDYEDIMTFTDKCLEMYADIDPKRVAVTGGSYGGFMTNWIIGHTDRFCCAASQRSISNWVSKSLATDIGYYHNMSQMASTPWDNVERMWGFSPLKYANKCVTPTLFIQSDEDYRCWMADALQMYTALKLAGCEARVCLFHHENHDLSRSGKPSNRRKRLEEMTNWFNKYCKKGE